MAGLQTCGVYCSRLTSGTGAPHVEGSNVDCIAVSRLQLYQGFTGRDAYNRPMHRSRAIVSRSPGTSHPFYTPCPLTHNCSAKRLSSLGRPPTVHSVLASLCLAVSLPSSSARFPKHLALCSVCLVEHMWSMYPDQCLSLIILGP